MEALLVLLAAAAVVGVVWAVGHSRAGTASVRRWMEEGRWELARERLKVLAEKGKDPEPRWLLSRVWEAGRDFEHAVVEQKIILRNGVFTARVHREDVVESLGRNYQRLKRPAEGLRFLEEELGRRDSRAGRIWKVRFLAMAGRMEEASQEAERLLKDHGGDPEVLAEAGAVYLRTGRTGPGKEMLETALRADRKLFRAWFHLGEHHKERKEWDKAVEAFENARHEKDLRLEALLELARCYRAKGMEKNAMDILERLAAEWEGDPYYARVLPVEFIAEVRYELADLHLYHKDYQEAIDQWQVIQSLVPDFRDVAAKLQSHARYGKDRIQDFLIAAAGEFEKICRFAMERRGYAVETRQVEGGERSYMVVREEGKGRPRRLLVGFYRTQAPVGESVLAEFERRMKEAGLAEGEVYSATGFTASGLKYVLDRPIRLLGKGTVMRLLKDFEGRFSSGH